ncbi:methyltransferase-like protein 17, mitochondrial [Trichogramma pretiosum]|uniref:methyltransferase-like protein 17, mitochondrial n=1 Tax=Trichogramma pretiosum TaxID=7493 RepID=UPI0006C97D62|nr:methyltransferase-like protein 17, mitochondrial [Trichogramma pretiosum]
MRVSHLFEKFKLSSATQIRWQTSSTAKYKLINEVEKLIEDNKIKPRKHPGIVKRGTVEMPKWIVSAIEQCLQDVQDKPLLLRERQTFSNYLFSRRLPLGDSDVKKIYREIEYNILAKKYGDLETIDDEFEIEKRRKIIKGEAVNKLKQCVYDWKPIEYNAYKSYLYMITRSVPEYAVLDTIFKEIQLRNPTFNPKSMFDFGSGVGSVLWAALERWNTINEYMGIDISADMCDLSEKIISLRPKKYKKAFFRQFLPVSNLQHDIVVSAYSLMELESAKSRLEVIAKLWKKTNQYLIIVEQGTNAGYKLVLEARDFVNYLMDTEYYQDQKHFIFSPCPHKNPCPRLLQNKGFPCNFGIQYMPLRLLGPQRHNFELYSYVVLKKGNPTSEDNWSRIVRPTLVRKNHVRCRMCTSEGQLEEVVVTKSRHGKPFYRCAKASGWGDRLSIEPNPSYEGADAVVIPNENEETDISASFESVDVSFKEEDPFAAGYKEAISRPEKLKRGKNNLESSDIESQDLKPIYTSETPYVSK